MQRARSNIEDRWPPIRSVFFQNGGNPCGISGQKPRCWGDKKNPCVAFWPLFGAVWRSSEAIPNFCDRPTPLWSVTLLRFVQISSSSRNCNRNSFPAWLPATYAVRAYKIEVLRNECSENYNKRHNNFLNCNQHLGNLKPQHFSQWLSNDIWLSNI